MKYFQFNNLNSIDLNLGIVDCKIQAPTPNILEISVPYQNGSYDFSTVGSKGLMTYKNRIINVDLNFLGQDKNDMYNIYSRVSTWLLGQYSKLNFNYINGFYKGKCTQISELSTFLFLGKITITFECEPFLQCGQFGNLIWDNLNFNIKENMETQKYLCKTWDVLHLINSGIDTKISLKASTDMIIKINNKDIVNLSEGINDINSIFKTGSNEIEILNVNSQNCTLEAIFDKEMI